MLKAEGPGRPHPLVSAPPNVTSSKSSGIFGAAAVAQLITKDAVKIDRQSGCKIILCVCVSSLSIVELKSLMISFCFSFFVSLLVSLQFYAPNIASSRALAVQTVAVHHGINGVKKAIQKKGVGYGCEPHEPVCPNTTKEILLAGKISKYQVLDQVS